MTIFEQLMTGQKIINDNVANMASNLDVVNNKVDLLIKMLSAVETEPIAPGAENKEQ